ncbi:unnamed protein product [Ostreobium quekettii]|uniref:Uncharacterized protein n=1 Tax=Ostreobium quekettii TaxID=121088 RepID=A0A8S1IRS5_9CHLO|nr:unnamed protein product [Ostreobium quekettii]|eukprot:evm.model.scf_139.3 EVM.evm.TU.scf_139.3   scf_139:32217-32576(-)
MQNSVVVFLCLAISVCFCLFGGALSDCCRFSIFCCLFFEGVKMKANERMVPGNCTSAAAGFENSNACWGLVTMVVVAALQCCMQLLLAQKMARAGQDHILGVDLNFELGHAMLEFELEY